MRLSRFDLGEMVGFQRPAGDREQAAFVFTDSAGQLLPAFEAVHVGGRSAHILDVAFETRQMGELFRFLQDGFGAAPAHRSPLVDGDRAEITFAITTAMGADRESDRLLQLDWTHLFIDMGAVAAGTAGRRWRPSRPGWHRARADFG